MCFSFTSTSYDRTIAEKYIHADAPYKAMIHIENPQHGALIGNNSTKPVSADLMAKADRKLKSSGKAAGRLLSDAFFTYSYTNNEPGGVRLTDKLNQTASYNFSEKTGTFKVTEFSGKSYTIYYFMRMDAAYRGKIRQIVDGCGRTVLSYRYDKLTGRILRVRDMAENELNFEYAKNGNLSLVTRRAADQNDPEPVIRYQYDQKNNSVEIARLGEGDSP